MKYRNYTIERTYYGKPAYQFQHNDFDGAPESYFSEHEQEPTSDTRIGGANSIEDAKEQIDEMEQERLHDLNIDWSFKEILERHDSNYCEWLVTGSKDGIDYFASVFSDAINPQFDESVFDIEIDK